MIARATLTPCSGKARLLQRLDELLTGVEPKPLFSVSKTSTRQMRPGCQEMWTPLPVYQPRDETPAYQPRDDGFVEHGVIGVTNRASELAIPPRAYRGPRFAGR